MTSTKSLLARALFVRHWRRCRHERHHQAIRQGWCVRLATVWSDARGARGQASPSFKG